MQQVQRAPQADAVRKCYGPGRFALDGPGNQDRVQNRKCVNSLNSQCVQALTAYRYGR